MVIKDLNNQSIEITDFKAAYDQATQFANIKGETSFEIKRSKYWQDILGKLKKLRFQYKKLKFAPISLRMWYVGADCTLDLVTQRVQVCGCWFNLNTEWVFE